MIIISDHEYRELLSDMQNSQRAAFAESTRKNLRTQWISYFEFCNYFNIQPLPASVQNICMYMYAQCLSRRLTAVSSLKNYLNAVRLLHVLDGYEYSLNDAVELKLVLKGIARLNPHCEKRAFAILPQILLDIHRNINLQNVNDVIFWCLYLFSFL